MPVNADARDARRELTFPSVTRFQRNLYWNIRFLNGVRRKK